MSSGFARVFAAAMTCSSSARPPTSCSTLGRLLLRRVPLPAAMMATANPVASMALSSHAKRGGLLLARSGRCTRLARWRRNGDVEVRDLAELGERWRNFRLVADDKDCQLGNVDVFVSDAGHIRCCHFFNAVLVFVEEVGRIAVEGEDDLLVQGLLRSVDAEDE